MKPSYLFLLIVALVGCKEKRNIQLEKALLENRYKDTAMSYVDKQSDALMKQIQTLGTELSNKYGDSVRYWGDSALYYNNLKP